jgi:hypothetical protein
MAPEDVRLAECCRSCGKPWREHLGCEGLCKQLVAVTAENQQLKDLVEIALAGRDDAVCSAKLALQVDIAVLRGKLSAAIAALRPFASVKDNFTPEANGGYGILIPAQFIEAAIAVVQKAGSL